MRAASQTGNADWFRIVNEASDGEESDTTDVYIMDEIGFWGTDAAEFVKKLAAITTPKISLHLNSPGGEIFDGIAIFNALRGHSAEVTVYVDGLAASAASFIAQAGDKVYMQRNATMMIHDGIALVYGNEKDMLDTASILNKLSNTVADMYAQRAGGTIEDWRDLMRAEVWYNAQEAVDAGLADKVLDTEDKEADKATNKWDLSIFNYAGRKEAPSPDRVRMTVLSNRAKEAPVGIKNETDGTTDAPPSGDPVTPPAAPGVPDAPVTEPESEPEPEPTGDPAPAETDPAPESTPTVTNSAAGKFTFSIGGKQTNDPAEAQRYINNIETAMREQVEQSRKSFVQSLAEGPAPKVMASKLEDLEKFALGLSEGQYNDWKNSWDFIQPSAALGQHMSDASGTLVNTSSVDARIKDLEDIVAYNRRGGMTEDQLKETSSYKQLTELRASANKES